MEVWIVVTTLGATAAAVRVAVAMVSTSNRTQSILQDAAPPRMHTEGRQR